MRTYNEEKKLGVKTILVDAKRDSHYTMFVLAKAKIGLGYRNCSLDNCVDKVLSYIDKYLTKWKVTLENKY
jgi:hypothetical protein